MDIILPIIIGLLTSISVFLLLEQDLIRIIVGISLMSNAANLFIFTLGRPIRGNPPLLKGTLEQTLGPFANPLAQAIILTAIVISFGLLLFALVLAYRYYREFETFIPNSEDKNEKEGA